MQRKRILAAFMAAILSSCGGSSSKKSSPSPASTGSKVDLSQNSTLQFYAASGIGVSAIRYVLRPSASTVEKYVPGSGSNLELEKSVNLSAAQLSVLTSSLSQLSKTNWGQCKACNATERTVWVEVSDGTYYYGTVSNCYCTGTSDKPTLTYSEIEGLYQSILAYFP